MKTLTNCRICNSLELDPILSLGVQNLTGVFPKSVDEKVTAGPLDLVLCAKCSLLQLGHSYSASEMYGENYGYRSSLNSSMARHLQNKVKWLEKLVSLDKSDLVVDIGSNDSTLLHAYAKNFPSNRMGFDPSAEKYREFYEDMQLISDFFSDKLFRMYRKGQLAKIVTSIAMFYDLENPAKFVEEVHEILDDEGVWHFEQSYMPSMLKTTAYDTICHEHLEFYSFTVVKKLLDENGFRVIDVQMNSINGGSFAVTACKKGAKYKSNNVIIDWLLYQEWNSNGMGRYIEFARKVKNHRESLLILIESLVQDGKKIIGYGASTKGNVLLQYCRLTTAHLSCIADVNPDKWGCFTPGTHIPIVSEEEARKMKPDYFLVFPWHFKHSILEREREFINNGGHFIFPLPEIEII